VRKLTVEPRLWRHLAAAAQTTDLLHVAEPTVRATAARWSQCQGVGFHSLTIRYPVHLSGYLLRVPFPPDASKAPPAQPATPISAPSNPAPSVPGSSQPQMPTYSGAPGPGQLPYPTYPQSMPLPYGATSSLPYPAYVPPQIPQGYNPYGGVPYPQQGERRDYYHTL